MTDEGTQSKTVRDAASRPLTDLPVSDEMAWAMVDASPDALVMVNESGVIELVNHPTEVLFGYDRGEMLGKPVEMLLPEEVVAVHRAHRMQYRAAPTRRAMGSGIDLWARRADGTEIPVEISLSPLTIDGQIHVLAAVRDVSERKAVEAAALRSKRGIDSIVDGVYMIEPETMRFVYANNGATLQTGFSTEELTDLTLLHFAPDIGSAEMSSLFDDLLGGSVEQHRFETVLRHRSGKDFPVEAIIEYPELGRDEPRLFVIVIRDVSKRKATEEFTKRIQHGIDSVADAVFMCDERTMEFTYVNQGAVDIHGYSREELLSGMTPADLAPDLNPSKLQAGIGQLADSPGASFRLRTDATRKDGTKVPVDVDINWPAPDRADGPRPLMAVVRDVSAERATETALRHSESRFRATFQDGPVPMTVIEVREPDIREMADVNQALADLFGYEREELIGRPAADLINSADVHATSNAALAVAAGMEAEYSSLVRGVHKDGSEMWLQRHISALDPEGSKNQLIVHVVDVTREIEGDLARRTQQALTDALSDVRLRMLQGASRANGLSLICESARNLLNGVGAAVLTPSGSDGVLSIEASAGVPDSVKARMSFRTTAGGVGEVFQTGEPQYLNGGNHPTMPDQNRAVLEERQVGPILMAPLPVGNEVAGVLLVIRLRDAEPFGDADLDPIQQFAAGAVSAIELAEARANQAALELLQDRERMGRDIHDNVIGRLFGTGMTLQASLSQVDNPALADRLTGAINDLDRAISDIRTAIYGVRSRAEWGKGVRGEILAAVAEQNEALGFEPSVFLDGPIDELPAPIVEHLLAVTREALTNTAKYANADNVSVSITTSGAEVELVVIDNGVGFAVAETADGLNGNGLHNLAARAAAVSGNATIDSRPGEGTTVRWTAPLRGPNGH